MRWPIRYQLLAPLLMLLLGVVGISTWTAVASADRAWQQLETQLRSIANTLSEPTFPLNQSVLNQVKGLSGAEYLLIAGDGERTATFDDSGLDLPPAETVAANWQSLRLGPRVTVGGQRYLCSGFRLLQRPEKTPATLYIFYPEALWRDALWGAIQPSLVLGGFAGLASVLLAVGVSQRLGRRIQQLERRTRLIAAGDFGPMPLPGRNDEIRDLTRSVNEMAQQLTHLQETVKKTERLRLLGQVSGGLAHQLRNGLTGARLALQVHAREHPPGEADGDALEVALRQLTLLEVNLKRFLDLGRSEAPRREPCSLSALIGEAVALLHPQCRHAHTELRWQPPARDLTVLGDAGQLGQLLLNVLGNAVQAAGPGGWVEVGYRLSAFGCRPEQTDPEHQATADSHPPNTDGRKLIADSRKPIAVIEVIDSGPGPPPEVAGRLFEPFVTSKPEGVGLGLAVARQVAESHGGGLSWQRDAGRTCFRIELPLEPGT
jgi:signal transduction histidine kinase